MKELLCFAIIPFAVGIVYAVLIALLIKRDKICEKKKRKKVAKRKHKIFSSV